MFFLEIFLLLAIPYLILVRLRKFGRTIIFNFTLYPLLFSYFYLLIPSFINFETPISTFIGLNENSFEAVGALSLWYVLIFLFVYNLSKENNFVFNHAFEPSPLAINASRFVLLLSIAICMLMFFNHGENLYLLSGNRSSSYEYYKKEILDFYKIQIFFNMSMASILVLVIFSKNFKYYFFSIPYVLLDILTGGRGYMFVVLMSFLLVYLLINPGKLKAALFWVVFFVIVVFILAFIRRSAPLEFLSDYRLLIVEFLGEFYYTRLTAEYVYLYQLGRSNVFDYFSLVISKLAPQFLIESLFSDLDRTRYDVYINDELNVGFGMAGSIIAEAYYYGGAYLSWLFPIVMSAFYFFCQKFFIIRSFSGFVFFAILIWSTYAIFRSAFFINIAALIYFFLVYLFFISFLGANSRMLYRVRDRQ